MDLDRREFTLGFIAASFASLALRTGTAHASGAVLDEPWAVWDKDAKPVRGGTLRIAAEQYIGKMNPNHWPVLDWVSMGYFHEKLMLTDGSYNPTVPWLAEQLTWYGPQEVLMRLRDGVKFHDGSPFDAKGVKFQIDWIRDPGSKTWDVSWLAQLDTVEVVDERTLRWKFQPDCIIRMAASISDAARTTPRSR
jgi:ABC-type transport system substrate-binding protein